MSNCIYDNVQTRKEQTPMEECKLLDKTDAPFMDILGMCKHNHKYCVQSVKDKCPIYELQLIKEKYEKSEKAFADLTNFISTRMLDDFTGYDEDAKAFDLFKAVKEIILENEEALEKLKQENEKLRDGIYYLDGEFCPKCGAVRHKLYVCPECRFDE